MSPICLIYVIFKIKGIWQYIWIIKPWLFHLLGNLLCWVVLIMMMSWYVIFFSAGHSCKYSPMTFICHWVSRNKYWWITSLMTILVSNVILVNHMPYWPFMRGTTSNCVFSSERASNQELWCLLWCQVTGDVTQWGQVTHICVSESTIFGSGKCLLPGWLKVIIWTGARILWIGPSGTNFTQWNFNRNLNIFIQGNALKMSSVKWCPFCVMLIWCHCNNTRKVGIYIISCLIVVCIWPIM